MNWRDVKSEQSISLRWESAVIQTGAYWMFGKQRSTTGTDIVVEKC